MHGEDSLDANSEADSTHRERFAQHFAAATHHHAFEWLDALFIALTFFQADVDANGIARAEFGKILAELRVLHTANYRFHFYLSVQTRSGGASLRRTICDFTEFRGFCLHEIANRVIAVVFQHGAICQPGAKEPARRRRYGVHPW